MIISMLFSVERRLILNIKLWDGKYRIKSDTRCYRLSKIKERKPKEGELVEEASELDNGTFEVTLGYFHNVGNCLKTIVDNEGRSCKCTTLEGYIKHLSDVYNKLELETAVFMKYFDTKTKAQSIIDDVITNSGGHHILNIEKDENKNTKTTQKSKKTKAKK